MRSTTLARWYRSTSRTGPGGIAAGSAAGSTGAYLPQAVIAAAHATAPSFGETDWTLICAAYDRLIALTG
ncbi:MAG: polymerase sigma-70 factor, subfamily, partial [Mycobacterium sp.]|nr:polymerase sigma-70 factor, subfamily [Mycobacterium sp.]